MMFPFKIGKLTRVDPHQKNRIFLIRLKYASRRKVLLACVFRAKRKDKKTSPQRGFFRHISSAD
jgi:hypothetical protein